MGYYASMEVDICILAENVPKARAELIRLSKEGVTSFDKFTEETKLDDWFAEHFHDCDCNFEDPAPLKQLALAADGEHTRGNLVISGGTHQKWRGWLESMLDAVAPFVTPNSTVHLIGEEHEQVLYQFKNGERTENWGKVVFDDERIPMIKAQTAIRAVKALVEKTASDVVDIAGLKLILEVCEIEDE